MEPLTEQKPTEFTDRRQSRVAARSDGPERRQFSNNYAAMRDIHIEDTSLVGPARARSRNEGEWRATSKRRESGTRSEAKPSVGGWPAAARGPGPARQAPGPTGLDSLAAAPSARNHQPLHPATSALAPRR